MGARAAAVGRGARREEVPAGAVCAGWTMSAATQAFGRSGVQGLGSDDRDRIAEILEATNSFRADEIEVALELFDESLANNARDYEFVGAFSDRGELIGYACYGATPGTTGTYEHYWIAVSPGHQGLGGGSRLLDEVERRLTDREARLLLAETS